MGSKEYRKYTKEFKLEALELLASSDKNASELERELGITPGLLFKWRKQYKIGEETGGLEPSDLAAAQAELKRMRRQLAAVSEERDILKKAIAIFSKEEKNGTGS